LLDLRGLLLRERKGRERGGVRREKERGGKRGKRGEKGRGCIQELRGNRRS